MAAETRWSRNRWLVVAVAFAAAAFGPGLNYQRAMGATTPLPQAAQNAIKKGKIAAGQHDYHLAASYFQKALNAAPNDTTLYYFLGLADAKIPGRELRAIHCFKLFLAANPDLPQQTRAAIQHEVSALKAANTTTALTPLPHAAMDAITKGKLAAGQGHFRAAALYFQQARTAAPADPIIYYYLGLTESKIPGRELRAICWFKAYLTANPSLPQSNSATIRSEIQALAVADQIEAAHLVQVAQNAAAHQLTASNQEADMAKVALLWAMDGHYASARSCMSLAGNPSAVQGAIQLLIAESKAPVIPPKGNTLITWLTGQLNTTLSNNVILDFTGYIAAIPQSGDPQKLFDAIYRAADAVVTRRLTIDDHIIARGGTYRPLARLAASNNIAAVSWLKQAAHQGAPGAQRYLSFLYVIARGVPQDYSKAMLWSREAAKQGNARAERNIGVYYDNGFGVPRNFTQAAQWFHRAAIQGNARAQCDLGVAYATGQGVPQDYAKAAAWFQRAAALGSIHAQFCLGCLYEYGHGVPQDYLTATTCFHKASAGHDIWTLLAEYYLGVNAQAGNGISPDAGQAQLWFHKANRPVIYVTESSFHQGVPQDWAARFAWFRLAATTDSAAESQWYLGVAYMFGLGVEPDYAAAVKWLRRAALQGYARAGFKLGELYQQGSGVPLDDAKAFRWMHSAAVQGVTGAEYFLGLYYFKGIGTATDYSRAAMWLQKAASHDFAAADDYLGRLYLAGQGEPQDYAQALALLRKAAAAGSGDAMNNIGNCYRNGQGVPQDYKKAMTWYRRAAGAGNAIAMKKICAIYLNGQGVARDVAEAMVWLRRAVSALPRVGSHAHHNPIKAAARLRGAPRDWHGTKIYGSLWENGQVTVRDFDKITDWYRKTANRGSAKAAFYLGTQYNFYNARAYFWISLAAKEGYAPAKGQLELIRP